MVRMMHQQLGIKCSMQLFFKLVSNVANTIHVCTFSGPPRQTNLLVFLVRMLMIQQLREKVKNINMP